MKILTLISFWMFHSLTYAQINCEKFRTGSFEIDNLDGTISTIIRSKKHQEEKSPTFIGRDKVKWTGECSFQLIPVELDDKTGIIGSQILTVTIVETGEHHYVMKVTGLGEGIEIHGKVYEKGYLNYDER